VCHDCGQFAETFVPAETLSHGKVFEAGHEGLGLLEVGVEDEGQHACALILLFGLLSDDAEELLPELVVGQGRVNDLLDFGVAAEVLGDFACVAAVALHSHVESAETAQHHRGDHRRTVELPHALRVRDAFLERLTVGRAQAHHCVRVPVDLLGARVPRQVDVRAVQRPHYDGSQERAVHRNNNVRVDRLDEFRDFVEVHAFECGVGARFKKDEFGGGFDEGLDAVQVFGGDLGEVAEREVHLPLVHGHCAQTAVGPALAVV